MFGTRVRCTGASLGYQGATLVGAGFSAMIAGSLVAGSDSSPRATSGPVRTPREEEIPA